MPPSTKENPDGFFEVVLSNKDERCVGQLFMRSLNRAI